MNFNSNQFPDLYDHLGIKIDKLGCIMLDVDASDIPNLIHEDDLYSTTHPDRFWIKGFTAGHSPHVTLLYGLIKKIANLDHEIDLYKDRDDYISCVQTALGDWKPEVPEIDHFHYFPSPYEDEPYYCVVAHLLLSQNLREAHSRLSLLPHINTFPDYNAHLTVAYIKKDEMNLQRILQRYNMVASTLKLKLKEINYGK